MKKTIATCLLTATVMAVAAQDMTEQSVAEEKVDLKAVYDEIDVAIEASPTYIIQRETEIQQLTEDYQREPNTLSKAHLAMQLFEVYKAFMNDSALHYIQEAITLADSVGRYEMSGRARALMARQCSNGGMYIEANDILHSINKKTLDEEGLAVYYNSWMHLCGEIGNYTSLPEVRQHYYELRDSYRDSLFLVADEGGKEFLHMKVSALIAKEQYQEALKTSDRWMSEVLSGSHEEAFAAYYRYLIYERLGNVEMQKYWLARSGLDDIRGAIMDQASLVVLAEILSKEGDTDRAFRYISYTRDCTNRFNTRLRSWSITPVLSIIEQSHLNSLRQARLVLIGSALGFCLMAFIMFLLWRDARKAKRQLETKYQGGKAE